MAAFCYINHMTNKKPKYEIQFAPGAFRNFEGTQAELDKLVAELTAMAESGELLENSEILTESDLEGFSDDELMQFAEIHRSLDDFFNEIESFDDAFNEMTAAEKRQQMDDAFDRASSEDAIQQRKKLH